MAVALLSGWPALSLGQPAVWLPPIHDATTGAPDTELTLVLWRAASLAAPRGWRWHQGEPERGACAAGCRIVRITGRRSPAPRYTISRLDLPSGPGASARLELPPGTPVFQIAEALAIKCSYLLEEEPPRSLPRTSEASPLSWPEADRLRSHSISLGPALMVGIDRASFTVGLEAGGTFSLRGPLALRAAVAYQDLGRHAGALGGVTYRAIAVHLMAGGWWARSWWGMGVFGGLSMVAHWLSLERGSLPGDTEVGVGLAAEARATCRISSRLSLGVSLRWIYLPDDAQVTVDNQELFRLAHVVFAPAVDLALSF